MMLASKLFRAVAFVAATLLIGFGIPLAWLLIAAELQGSAGITRMTSTTAAAVFPGIVISYALVMYVVGWAMSRKDGDRREASSRNRYPWLRSMRDQPQQPAKATPLEVMFILAAASVSIAFMVWFFLWAGNPLPA
jgi:hypothetical protein